MADGIPTETTCLIAGGGPAGMMLGYLLARAGIDVTVLEKHADFLRDFRGDTIHPSTLDVMGELGLLEDFLKLPHSELRHIGAEIGIDRVPLADFSGISARNKFIALMPQWDFLDFLAARARRYSNFHLLLRAEATGLTSAGGAVTGLHVRMPDGMHEIRARLTVAADGRHSVLREAAGLEMQNLGAPMDVLWFRLSRHADDPPETFGKAEAGHMIVMLDRTDYWQCAYLIAKGSHAELQAAGIEALRAAVVHIQPFLADRVGELRSWDDVKLLTVAVDRLRRWHKPGLLLIGDAAHAMSPIGGVGVNLAVQDAVASANLLVEPLRGGAVPESALEAVQKRREFPTRVTQGAQVLIQKQLISPLLKMESGATIRAPWFIRAMVKVPGLRRLPAQFVGVGVRPEHVHSPTAGETLPEK